MKYFRKSVLSFIFNSYKVLEQSYTRFMNIVIDLEKKKSGLLKSCFQDKINEQYILGCLTGCKVTNNCNFNSIINLIFLN